MKMMRCYSVSGYCGVGFIIPIETTVLSKLFKSNTIITQFHTHSPKPRMFNNDFKDKI